MEKGIDFALPSGEIRTDVEQGERSERRKKGGASALFPQAGQEGRGARTEEKAKGRMAV